MDEEQLIQQQELQMQKAQQFAMTELMGSCPAKTVLGGAAGFGMGALFGLFMSSADNALDDKFLRLTVKEQATITFKEMMKKSYGTAKVGQSAANLTGTAQRQLMQTFGVLSAVFVSTECITESIRGKEDRYNALISGCVTGAILSRSAGIQAMALGCGGFAAFQLAIDQYTHHTRHNN